MDVIERALRDLGAPGDRSAQSKSRYLEFKTRVRAAVVEAFGDDAKADRFLEDYFLSYLPAVLRAAADQEGLSNSDCEKERALVEEVLKEKKGILAHSPILYPLNRICFEQVPHQRPALDLGIGNGRSSQYCLAGRELDAGADVIVSNLVGAKRRRSHNNLYALDIAALPFKSESFRTVYALNCIYHVQAGRAAGLTEMARVLAPGGTLALTDVSPYLNDFKPLESFFASLGFEKLASDFTQYFLSGYGADGSPGDPDWYRSFIQGLGLIDVEVRYLMSPQLSRLGYLFYDWQALFNLDATGKLGEEGGERRYNSAYRPMLMSLVAPLIKLDAEHCRKAGKGGYIFITARKPGSKPDVSFEPLVCPESRTPLRQDLSCPVCNRIYPKKDGIPLLATFFADADGVKKS